MRLGLGAALLALTLLALVCLAPSEAACGCDEAACASDCRTPCCVASVAPFLPDSPTTLCATLPPRESTFETPSTPCSADPRDILHVPKAARS